MRIIDKNKDYYDYLQCYEDDVVYDRENSYILTNEDICGLWLGYNKRSTDEIHLLLQIGYSNWLMVAKVISYNNTNGFLNVEKYSLELVEYWKNYQNNNPLKFGSIESKYSIEYFFSKKFNLNAKLSYDVKHNNYTYRKLFNEKIPNLIFRETKIPSVVKAEDLYNAFDEYFHHLKDDIDCEKMTDEEKIESHGFDKKTSFRNIKG